MRRLTRPDTYVPFHFGNQLQVLPSFKSALETCASLLALDIAWEQRHSDVPGQMNVLAVGSGPADESVDVIQICVRVGEAVVEGQVVAEVEATKSVVEIAAQAGGTVAEIYVTKGQRVRVPSARGCLHTEFAAESGFRSLGRSRTPIRSQTAGSSPRPRSVTSLSSNSETTTSSPKLCHDATSPSSQSPARGRDMIASRPTSRCFPNRPHEDYDMQIELNRGQEAPRAGGE